MFGQRWLFLAVLTAAGALIGFSPGSAEGAHGGGHGGGGHGGGFHGGGFHGGGFHGGGFHGGAFHGGGFHGAHVGAFRGGNRGFYHGGYNRGFYRNGGYGPYYGWGLGYGLGWPYAYSYGDNWPYTYSYGDNWPYTYSYGDNWPYDYNLPYYDVTPPVVSNPPITSSDMTSTGDLGYYPPPPPTDNTVNVRVIVPANAEVWFDDSATQQRGSVREFVSPPLTPGRQYTYEIRARWREGDHDVTRTRNVNVQAGQTVTVDFTKGK